MGYDQGFIASPHAVAFSVWQRDYDSLDPVPFDPILEQVCLTTRKYSTGLSFGALQLADPLRTAPDTVERGGRVRIRAASALRRPDVVTQAQDIVL